MDECIDLPPGFRFHPTDEEIITHYLLPKVLDPSFFARAIGDVDLNKCEPWDLPSKAKMGEKEWYFFVQRDRKYPTGTRTNRATEAGYWKATGKDKEIFRGRGVLVGMKKTLVFYKGRAPRGEKSNWVMHEFRLEGKSLLINNLPRPAAKDDWVVSRVFHKSNGVKKSPMPVPRIGSFGDLLDSTNLPPLMDSTPYFNKPSSSNYIADGSEHDCFDYKGILSGTAPMTSPYFSAGGSGGFDDFSSGFANVNQMPSSNFYNQMEQIPTPTTSQFMQPGSINSGYLHPQDQPAGQRQCKLEQLPNHSMVSDDTGLSTDRNTEISSVVSRHDMGSCASTYDDLDLPATGPALDLDNMWNC